MKIWSIIPVSYTHLSQDQYQEHGKNAFFKDRAGILVLLLFLQEQLTAKILAQRLDFALTVHTGTYIGYNVQIHFQIGILVGEFRQQLRRILDLYQYKLCLLYTSGSSYGRGATGFHPLPPGTAPFPTAHQYTTGWTG